MTAVDDGRSTSETVETAETPLSTEDQSRDIRPSRGRSDLGILIFAIVAFGVMMVVPAVGRALGAVLLAVMIVVPAAFLGLSLRRREEAALEPILCLVLALSFLGVVLNSAIRRGPDWRLGIFGLSGVLWLIVAGIGWTRRR